MLSHHWQVDWLSQLYLGKFQGTDGYICLIALSKCPGVWPVVVGETLSRMLTGHHYYTLENFRALMVICVIVLNKCPGVWPNWVGETLSKIVGKVVCLVTLIGAEEISGQISGHVQEPRLERGCCSHSACAIWGNWTTIIGAFCCSMPAMLWI